MNRILLFSISLLIFYVSIDKIDFNPFTGKKAFYYWSLTEELYHYKRTEIDSGEYPTKEACEKAWERKAKKMDFKDWVWEEDYLRNRGEKSQ